MAYPRKPPELKALSGSRQPDPHPPIELPTLAELPAPPSWVGKPAAIAEWNRLGPILVANKLLTTGGLSAFAVLCAWHGELVEMWSAGERPTGQMVAQYRNLVNDFGLTPVAQGKVKPSGKQADANPFARNGARMVA